MAYNKKNDIHGNIYYSFVVYDYVKGKNVRLKKKDIENRFGKLITTEEEAQQVERLLKAEYESAKLRYEKKLEWMNKFYSFKALLDQYTERQKKRAPKGWKNSVHYLKYYVLPFFLEIRENNNITSWHLDYPHFITWLEEEATLIRDKDKKISYSSKNHSIKALNTFMRQLFEHNIVDRLHICECFDESLLNERTVDDVIQQHEADAVFNMLIEMGHPNEAEYFLMLYWTGMRFNEGLGISLADIYKGHIPKAGFKNLLKRNGIFYYQDQYDNRDLYHLYYGYFTLMSQPDNGSRNIVRDSNGVIKRKPLKMKKAINEKNTRVIPIINKDLWKVLVTRAKKASTAHKNKSNLSPHKSDYLLFPGISKTTSTNRLKEAFRKVNMRYRSWHCCRHTRGTYLHSIREDTALGKRWLGHVSERVYQKYVHTHEALIREISSKNTNWEDDDDL